MWCCFVYSLYSFHNATFNFYAFSTRQCPQRHYVFWLTICHSCPLVQTGLVTSWQQSSLNSQGIWRSKVKVTAGRQGDKDIMFSGWPSVTFVCLSRPGMLTRPEVSRPRPLSQGQGHRHARPRPRPQTCKAKAKATDMQGQGQDHRTKAMKFGLKAKAKD